MPVLHDMFVLFHFRNASKKKETQSQINEVDMYDLPNAKSGKFNFERLELEGTAMYHLFSIDDLLGRYE